MQSIFPSAFFPRLSYLHLFPPFFQILKLQEKLLALQEEKHQLFLQLKKVLHEEEKRRRKEQRWDWRAENKIGQNV